MHRFKTPVVVESGVLGRFRIVTGPADALEVMKTRWPERESSQYRKALDACRGAALGKLPPHIARNSFVAAARAARVLVSRETFRQYTLGSVDPVEACSLAVGGGVKGKQSSIPGRQPAPDRNGRRTRASH